MDVVPVAVEPAVELDASLVPSADLLKTDDEVVAAGKPKKDFRVYGTGSAPREASVTRHYTLMRSNQTLDFVKRMEEKVTTADYDGPRARRAPRRHPPTPTARG